MQKSVDTCLRIFTKMYKQKKLALQNGKWAMIFFRKKIANQKFATNKTLLLLMLK